MRLFSRSLFALLVSWTMLPNASFSEEDSDTSKGAFAPYYAAQMQPPFTMDADGIDWEFEIRVSLPGSYDADASTHYPVLWVLDGALYHGTATELANVNAILGRMPYVIVVSVGYPATDPRTAYSAKRTRDFFFEGFVIDASDSDDPAAQLYKAAIESAGGDPSAPSPGNGHAFLGFLVDSLRPMLSKQYRMTDEHVLFGHSGGGMFTSRALFARPNAFSGYIISSGTPEDSIRAEMEFAEANDDLEAKVFISAGDQEVAVNQYAAIRLVSNTIKYAENLALRNYPSLDLEVQLHHGKDHATVWPSSLAEGMIWAFMK